MTIDRMESRVNLFYGIERILSIKRVYAIDIYVDISKRYYVYRNGSCILSFNSFFSHFILKFVRSCTQTSGHADL